MSRAYKRTGQRVKTEEYRVIEAKAFVGLLGYICPNYKDPIQRCFMEMSQPVDDFIDSEEGRDLIEEQRWARKHGGERKKHKPSADV